MDDVLKDKFKAKDARTVVEDNESKFREALERFNTEPLFEHVVMVWLEGVLMPRGYFVDYAEAVDLARELKALGARSVIVRQARGVVVEVV